MYDRLLADIDFSLKKFLIMKKGEYRNIRISSEYSDYSLESNLNENHHNDYSKQMGKQNNSKYLGKRDRSSINDHS
jgi:hypothetical protein